MPTPYDYIPDEVKKELAQEGKAPEPSGEKKKSAPRRTDDSKPAADKKKGRDDAVERGPFKHTRANQPLTKQEVKEIKAGRKALRKEMKRQKIYTKKEFELMASSLGLYFDKHNPFAFLGWLFRGRGLWALLGALLALLFIMVIMSWAMQMRGHFTINMSEEMFNTGFVLSETEDFRNPSTHLFSDPAESVPCISISNIPSNVDKVDGSHNEDYFAYTFYARNEGEYTVDYTWSIELNSESKSVSSAAWIMVFEDGEMQFFAQPSADGSVETIPGRDDTRHGYPNPQFLDVLADASQYELVRSVGDVSYYRAVPLEFVDDVVVASGRQNGVSPGAIHKYTVVMWLEGDDPECTDALVGGHLGIEMNLRLVSEEGEDERPWLERFLGGLLWWQD